MVGIYGGDVMSLNKKSNEKLRKENAKLRAYNSGLHDETAELNDMNIGILESDGEDDSLFAIAEKISGDEESPY